ncbi:MAG: ABC transporter ATP-binding protein [Solirubrobacterales bacterium]|nr:ABC transporter ATP-binding protein [Solirubrobacterales bacterium]
MRKTYGDREAVRGIDLEVHAHEVLAVLGPNGAGKTTTIEILEGYRDRTAGEVEVLGIDPGHGTREWRGRLGIVPQDTALQPYLTVRESLELYAGYFPAPKSVAEVVALVGLEGQEKVRAGKLSGGQKRRLDVGIALVGDPDLLFLDEPTTGFDPSARRNAWEMVSGLRDLGKTIVLTTHYMDEAQALADRVAIIRDGRLVALDTPQNLGGRENLPTRITFRLAAGAGIPEIPGLGRPEPVAEHPEGDMVVLETLDPVADLNRLTGWAVEQRVELEDLEVRRPSLEEIYLEVTG